MEITFAPNGIVQIDDARIIYKNFSGAGDKFNREGDRNFTLVIPNMELADLLMNDKNKYGVGWNVKIKEPREEGDEPFIKLLVKVKFPKDQDADMKDRGPFIYLVSNGRKKRLTESTVSILDRISISKVDLDIRPYDDTINGKPFRAAYLQGIKVYQNITDRFAEEESPEE